MNSFYTTLVASALAGVASGGDLADYVDPFVGTSSTGHTTPAAALPFGLVQAGPDTGNDGWEYCSITEKSLCKLTLGEGLLLVNFPCQGV